MTDDEVIDRLVPAVVRAKVNDDERAMVAYPGAWSPTGPPVEAADSQYSGNEERIDYERLPGSSLHHQSSDAGNAH